MQGLDISHQILNIAFREMAPGYHEGRTPIDSRTICNDIGDILGGTTLPVRVCVEFELCPGKVTRFGECVGHRFTLTVTLLAMAGLTIYLKQGFACIRNACRRGACRSISVGCM
jgi:hypothetical protein